MTAKRLRELADMTQRMEIYSTYGMSLELRAHADELEVLHRKIAGATGCKLCHGSGRKQDGPLNEKCPHCINGVVWPKPEKREKADSNLHLSVDDRKEKPFHCDKCGDDYVACKHWDKEKTDTDETERNRMTSEESMEYRLDQEDEAEREKAEPCDCSPCKLLREHQQRKAEPTPAPVVERNPLLLPCPFCGGASYRHETVNGTQMLILGCSSCGIEFKATKLHNPSGTVWSRDVDAAWNKRAQVREAPVVEGTT